MVGELTMTVAPRLALQRGYATRTFSMSSILASTASRASRMLVDAASAAAVAIEGGERWWLMDHFGYFVMLTAWVNIWILRAFMDFFSSGSSMVGRLRKLGGEGIGIEGLQMAAGPLVLHGGLGLGPGWSSSNRTDAAIGGALSHILRILDDTPAASRKYELMLSMADKLIADNLQHCHVGLHDITRSVLSSAFSRTCELLGRSFRQSEASTSATWPSRVIRLLPLGSHLAAGYDALCQIFSSLLQGTSTWKSSISFLNLAIVGPNSCSNECLEAEKLAQELLWITSKMKTCPIVGEAILKWGFASSLASLALTAHPRVQGSIVKVSAMLFWEVEGCEVSNAFTVATCAVLCKQRRKRLEVEMAVDGLIMSLPLEDQEVILRNWLEDFAATNSDWPNLQGYFDRWCRNSRRPLYVLPAHESCIL